MMNATRRGVDMNAGAAAAAKLEELASPTSRVIVVCGVDSSTTCSFLSNSGT